MDPRGRGQRDLEVDILYEVRHISTKGVDLRETLRKTVYSTLEILSDSRRTCCADFILIQLSFPWQLQRSASDRIFLLSVNKFVGQGLHVDKF